MDFARLALGESIGNGMPPATRGCTATPLGAAIQHYVVDVSRSTAHVIGHRVSDNGVTQTIPLRLRLSAQTRVIALRQLRW